MPRRCSPASPRYEAPTVDVDGLDYRESLQVVRIEAGIANNVVPDRCEIVVNRRYAPACSFDDALAQTRALFADADEVEIVSASPAARAEPHRTRSSPS